MKKIILLTLLLLPLNLSYAASVHFTAYGGREATDGIAASQTDSEGNIYLFGNTQSRNWGNVRNLNPGGLGGMAIQDMFLTKLSRDGSELFTLIIGGNGNDVAKSMALDANNNVYLTGNTSSGNFPSTENSVQPGRSGGAFDAFVMKLDPNGAMLYSTYLGGLLNDEAQDIAVDSNGNAHVVGFTNSRPLEGGGGFPQQNPMQQFAWNTDTALDDAFLTVINANGTGLIFSSFLGGAGTDRAHAVAVDSSGNSYLTGSTNSTLFQSLNGAPQVRRDIGRATNPTLFIAKINPAIATYQYFSYIGWESPMDRIEDIAVRSDGRAFVVGTTTSRDFTTTENALDRTCGATGNCGSNAEGFERIYSTVSDAFVLGLAPDGNLSYGTYFGGDGRDEGKKIAFYPDSNLLYVAGSTLSRIPLVREIQALPTEPNQTAYNFLLLLDPSAQRSEDALRFSTVLGAPGNPLNLEAMAPDSQGYITLAGNTTNQTFRDVLGGQSLLNENFFRPQGGNDGYVIELDMRDLQIGNANPPARVDLYVSSMTATPVEPTVGQNIEIQTRILNRGPDDTTVRSQVILDLPRLSGVQFLSAQIVEPVLATSCQFSNNAFQVVCGLGGEVKREDLQGYTVSVRLTSEIAQALTLTGRIAPTEERDIELDPSNNQSSITVTVLEAPPSGVIRFLEPSYQVFENPSGLQGTLREVLVARVGGTSERLVARYQVGIPADNSTLDEDYQVESVRGELVWGDGDGETKSIPLEILDDDLQESEERLTIRLTGDSVCGDPCQTVILIESDERPAGGATTSSDDSIPDESAEDGRSVTGQTSGASCSLSKNIHQGETKGLFLLTLFGLLFFKKFLHRKCNP